MQGKKLRTQSLDVSRHGDGFDAVRIIWVLNTKRAGFKAFTQHRVATHDDVFLNDHFVAPFLDAGVNLNALAIGGGAHEFGVDF